MKPKDVTKTVLPKNGLIANTFQMPNMYVDQLWCLLTPEETKVLVYFCRRIFGFQKKSDQISLSQLCNGIETGTGEMLDFGTGLSKTGNQRAINSLLHYGVVREVAPPNFGKRIAARYALQLDAKRIDLDGLVERLELKNAINTKRTAGARAAERKQK